MKMVMVDGGQRLKLMTVIDKADTEVTVEGCEAKVSREEASAILAETPQLTEGPERDRFTSSF